MADEIGFEVNIHGLEELLQKMEKLPAEINRLCMQQALEAGGKVMFTAVEARTPERTDAWTGGDSLQPGELRNSLQTKVLVAGGSASTLSTATIQFRNRGGKDFGYVANLVELGHVQIRKGARSYRKNAGDVIGHVPAHPFMRPGADESAREAIEVFSETLKAGIDSKICTEPAQ